MGSTFGHYVVAIICPPLYFLLRRRWVAGVIHSFVYLAALLTLIFGIGIVFWAFGAVHAAWDLRSRMQEEVLHRQASLLAQEMRRSEPQP